MKSSLCFKLVKRATNGLLVSYNTSQNERWQPVFKERLGGLIYTPNVPRTPLIKGSKLFAFSDLESALKFRDRSAECWLAEIKNGKPFVDYANKSLDEDLRNYWKKLTSSRKIYRGQGYANTLVGDSITLLAKLGV